MNKPSKPSRILILAVLLLAANGPTAEARGTGSGPARAKKAAGTKRAPVKLRTKITGTVNNARNGQFSGSDVGEMEMTHTAKGGAAKKGAMSLRFTHSPSFPGGDFDLRADVLSDRTRTYKTGTRTRTVKGIAPDGTEIRVSKTKGGRRDGVLRVNTSTPTETRSFEAFP